MKDPKFFYKKGKRYIAIDEYRDGFYGLPSDGLLYKHDTGLTCFLHPNKFDKNLDIQKLSYLQTKKNDITKKIMDSNLKVYNISCYDFILDVIEKVSITDNAFRNE